MKLGKFGGKLKKLYLLLTGKTSYLKPATLTVRNMWAVIQAFFRKKLMTIDGFSISPHIYEQIIWRRTQVAIISPTCWESGTCKVCGCEILGKTMEDRECSAGEVNLPLCYPAMMSKEKWEDYKKNNNIKLFN